MQKQILVKTPLTENGMNPVFGEDGKQAYTESLLVDNPGEHSARRILEKRNATLPKHLQVIIEDAPDAVIPTAKAATPVTSALDQLKIQAENEKLKAELALLKSKPVKATA